MMIVDGRDGIQYNDDETVMWMKLPDRSRKKSPYDEILGGKKREKPNQIS